MQDAKFLALSWKMLSVNLEAAVSLQPLKNSDSTVWKMPKASGIVSVEKLIEKT